MGDDTYRTLIEHAPEAIGVTREGRTIFANRALARFLGYETPEAVIGTTVRARIHDDDRATFDARVAAGTPGDVPNTPREYRVVRTDGAVVVTEIVSLVVADYDGAPARICFLRDVTERTRLRARLQQTDRLAAIGTLASGVAHEINNPLAYAMANLEVLGTRQLPKIRAAIERAFGAVPVDLEKELADAADMVATAREGSERVRDIVRNLRTFSRADDGPSVPVDVRRIVDASLSMASHEISHRARLVKRYADQVPDVDGNESRLGQVFLNLLLNAAQSIPPGRQQDHEIRVEVLARAPSHVVVSIADTGVGMTEETTRRMFDPFFTTKPQGTGTGLGLSVAHGIVTGLSGTMRVESGLGRGTTFFVDLPASVAR